MASSSSGVGRRRRPPATGRRPAAAVGDRRLVAAGRHRRRSANRIPTTMAATPVPTRMSCQARAAFDEPADDQRRRQGPEAEAHVEQVHRPAALGLEQVEVQPVHAAVEGTDAETRGQGDEQEDGPRWRQPQRDQPGSVEHGRRATARSAGRAARSAARHRATRRRTRARTGSSRRRSPRPIGRTRPSPSGSATARAGRSSR